MHEKLNYVTQYHKLLKNVYNTYSLFNILNILDFIFYLRSNSIWVCKIFFVKNIEISNKNE